MGELVATLALAQDNAFGQPLESQLRSCLLSAWFCEAAVFDSETAETTYWVALLRYLGCTGHAHEVATVFGDEIAIRAQTLIHDAANPAEVMQDAISFATAQHPPEAREAVVSSLQAGAHDWAVNNFASGCEVGDMLAERLAFPRSVRDALAFTFERWNGKGYPNGAAGEQIPLPMRVVHLTHDMEAISRNLSVEAAMDAARDRSDRTYDPALVEVFVDHGMQWFDQLQRLDPWDAVLALEPQPYTMLQGPSLDEALTVVADFIDLKSPYMAGHSRRCADLASDAGQAFGLEPGDISVLRRAALAHELGTTGVPNSIWDKPSVLTKAEFDRVEVHAMLTEQMLRRSPALAQLNPVASCHHERADGSGYHKRLKSNVLEPAGCLLAAIDVYVGLTTDRADRPAFSNEQAAAMLRSMADDGTLVPDAVNAVLTASGHNIGSASARNAERPAGLTQREVEVLCLAARGLTTREIGEELFISPKTVDHHIQHVYTKIGTSTRAAAALWAMQNQLVS